MTVGEVQARVAAIRAAAYVERDDERAHALEDGLWRDVLLALADSSALAREAIVTIEIDFARHCG